MLKIKSITCHRIVNSRGDWTIETKITLDDGSEGIQTIPDGASKGENEAVYIPVRKSVDIVSTVINDALKGENAEDYVGIDNALLSMDGTPNKSNLGANSILSVSLALSKAVAESKKLELYQYLSFLYSGKCLKRDNLKFPIPVFNVINGGKHANNGLSFQEFMVIPALGTKYEKCMDIGVDVYKDLEKILQNNGFDVDVGDEGGFAPNGLTAEKALDFVTEAVSKKFKIEEEVTLGLDVAAESFYDSEEYKIEEENLLLSRKEFLEYYKKLLSKYKITYVEDPYYERDTQAWKDFMVEFGDKIMVVADDLVVTNPRLLKDAISQNLANAVIVKPNQIGTLSETFDFIKLAQKNKMTICVSHRSGDTAEDTFIADLSLAVGAEFMKSGAPVRGERVAKYNRLLDIYLS